MPYSLTAIFISSDAPEKHRVQPSMTSRCIGNWSTWKIGIIKAYAILKKRFPRSWPLYVASLSLCQQTLSYIMVSSVVTRHYSTNTYLSSRTLTLLALWLVVGPQKLLLAPKFGSLTCLIKSRLPNDRTPPLGDELLDLRWQNLTRLVQQGQAGHQTQCWSFTQTIPQVSECTWQNITNSQNAYESFEQRSVHRPRSIPVIHRLHLLFTHFSQGYSGVHEIILELVQQTSTEEWL